MDDEPMWVADCVIAPTPGPVITIPKTANEFAIKDKVLLKLDRAKNQKPKSPLKKTIAFTDKGSSNSDTNKIMARMEAITMKMDAQYKKIQSHAKCSQCGGNHSTADCNDDDTPKSREAEAKFRKTFRLGPLRGEQTTTELPRDWFLIGRSTQCSGLHYLLDEEIHIVRAVLGQKDGKHFHPIYFANKTLNAAQQDYTVTEKELMAIVFAFDKFRPYLVLSKTVVYTDHSAFRHLFKNHDAKPRLIRWILLLKEFDIKIKDKKGTENVAANHLSRIENDETSDDDDEIDDKFPGETLMEISTRDVPWTRNSYHIRSMSPWTYRWTIIKEADTIVRLYEDGKTFIVNDHRLKLHHEEDDYNDRREELTPFFSKNEPPKYESS
nr:reverse transcriptase domain-containing protein [Tanacetum cinerariifolium]